MVVQRSQYHQQKDLVELEKMGMVSAIFNFRDFVESFHNLMIFSDFPDFETFAVGTKPAEPDPPELEPNRTELAFSR